MTPIQWEFALLLIKGIMKGCERLNKVGEMTDEQCRAAIPLVQEEIDKNDAIIQEL